MKQLVGMTVGGVLLASLMAVAYAAPAQSPAKGSPQPGLKNAKRAMLAKLQRDNKVLVAKKKGIAVRQQSMTKKGAAQ